MSRGQALAHSTVTGDHGRRGTWIRRVGWRVAVPVRRGILASCPVRPGPSPAQPILEPFRNDKQRKAAGNSRREAPSQGMARGKSRTHNCRGLLRLTWNFRGPCKNDRRKAKESVAMPWKPQNKTPPPPQEKRCSCGKPGDYCVNQSGHNVSYWKCRECHEDSVRKATRRYVFDSTRYEDG